MRASSRARTCADLPGWKQWPAKWTVGQLLADTAFESAAVVVEGALTDVVPGDAVVVRRLLAELDAVAFERLGKANGSPMELRTWPEAGFRLSRRRACDRFELLTRNNLDGFRRTYQL